MFAPGRRGRPGRDRSMRAFRKPAGCLRHANHLGYHTVQHIQSLAVASDWFTCLKRLASFQNACIKWSLLGSPHCPGANKHFIYLFSDLLVSLGFARWPRIAHVFWRRHACKFIQIIQNKYSRCLHRIPSILYIYSW